MEFEKQFDEMIKKLRIQYFKKYEGILPEKTISDSADWLSDFIKPFFSQATEGERKRGEK
jgi:hypothetical protein